jgi:hypothetical protein
MTDMDETRMIKGFKVFNPDWTCRSKQYTCPGKFEEDVALSICEHGMHFCKVAADCFRYYNFNPDNKVAEVIAYGEVVEGRNKCATDKLEIVREIPWAELLEIVNTGKGCTGLRNTGDWNTGNRNTGNRNTGDCNTGDWNTGGCNTGDCNTGNRNTGDWNTGGCNTGDCNTGNRNTGDCNTGDCNTGDWNTGNRNTGNRNTGDCNTGNRNTGEWNKCSFSNGCFNTVEPKIHLFNKPSEWTFRDWLNSEARYLLNRIPSDALEWIWFGDMTDDEKEAHPGAETTGGYLKQIGNSERAVIWWRGLSDCQKAIITAIPNFDKEIFKEITGIDVEKD